MEMEKISGSFPYVNRNPEFRWKPYLQVYVGVPEVFLRLKQVVQPVQLFRHPPNLCQARVRQSEYLLLPFPDGLVTPEDGVHLLVLAGPSGENQVVGDLDLDGTGHIAQGESCQDLLLQDLTVQVLRVDPMRFKIRS